MENASLQRIQDVLQKSNSIAVTVGKNPSIDDMGAALALYLSLQAMGKNVTIVCVSEPIVEISNLVGIDKVKTKYEAESADLVVAFPYREGEIEKVSYTLENGYLNIVVKAGEQGLTFAEQDVKYTRGNDNQLDLLFVVGSQRISDINDIFDVGMLKNVTVVNIDNKQDNQGYGDIVLVSPRFSSVSEQIAQILSDIKAPVDTDIAQNLFDGIMFATDNFQSQKTSFLAFEMAAILMRQGAVRSVRQPVSGLIPVPLQPQGQRRVAQQLQPQERKPQFEQRRQQIHQPTQQVLPNQRFQQSQPQQPKHNQQQNPPTDWLTPKVYKGSSNV
jgi:nanoRNase/pAp phosphatase (c-di-AMP/oligoRNAs hydrolase)